jgi:tRNA (guanine37-N1)-methyltransferase
MRFDILTIFPKILDSYFSESILKRAQEKGLIQIQAHDIRAFSKDKHRKVDDRPYGGGAGMVMLFEPIAGAVQKAISNFRFSVSNGKRRKPKRRTILLSTRGKVFTNQEAKRLSKYDQLIFICGRYEGVDERVAQYVADEEISLGDYVITGGELGAAIIIDAVSRQIPGVLGKLESLEENQGSYPVFTKPDVIRYKPMPTGRQASTRSYKLLKVPPVLLEGNHKLIDAWRKEKGGVK